MSRQRLFHFLTSIQQIFTITRFNQPHFEESFSYKAVCGARVLRLRDYVYVCTRTCLCKLCAHARASAVRLHMCVLWPQVCVCARTGCKDACTTVRAAAVRLRACVRVCARSGCKIVCVCVRVCAERLYDCVSASVRARAR